MPDERIPCPECGDRFTQRGMGSHRLRKHGVQRKGDKHGKQGARFSPQVKATILQLCREGVSRNEIARRLKVSAAGVGAYVQREHERTGDELLTFDRGRTAAATEAHKVDMAARRAELAQGLLDDVARLRAELFAPTIVFAFGGKENTYAQHEVDEPPVEGKLKLAQAMGALIDRHLKLDTHDADDGQALTAVDAFLKGMIG